MYSIGIDLGGTNIAVGLCDGELNIIDKVSAPTLSHRDNDEIVADMAMLCKKITERNSLSENDVDFVGIAAPGSINGRDGVVEASYNIKMLSYPMRDKFLERFPAKAVYLANDANAAALGEALKGAGRGAKNLVMITLGTGVGSGVVIDGKIFAGGLNDFGAEIGHTVIEVGGRPCTCGRRGCFEAYSSASALTALTKERMQELRDKGIDSKLFECEKKEGKISARTAFDAMRMGDEEGKKLVDYYINHLACGLTNIVNIFQPEVITLGGGVCNEKETLTVPLSEIVSREQYTHTIPKKCVIKTAELKNDAGIIGAAALGRV